MLSHETGMNGVDRELIVNLFVSLFTAAICAWSLYNRDNEAHRLLRLDKFWRPLQEGENESARLEKIKRRMLIGYSIFLCLSIAWFVFFMLRFGKRL
jgi:hypothetical protein